MAVLRTPANWIWGLACASTVACSGPAVPASDGTLVTPYLAIGDVLAADSLGDLDKLGAQVVVAARSQSESPGVDQMVVGAGRVAAQDIDTARAAYRKMSLGMIEHLAAHPDERDGLLIIHCPMTFEGEGARWVQKEGPIMNPYEGAMMLHCGDAEPWEDRPGEAVR